MKNINTTNIKDKQNDKIAFIALKIADWKNEKTLNSLWNPNDIVEAKANLVKIMMWNSKYTYYFPVNDGILNNILYVAFEKGVDVKSAINIFKMQKSSDTAKARIEVLTECLWPVANKSYKPENEVDYSGFEEAIA